MKDGIELLWQPRVKIVAPALGFRAVDNSNGAF
jgi:hypothetical protein